MPPPLLQSLCWSTSSPALAAPPAGVAPRQLQYRVPGAGPFRRDGASVEGGGKIQGAGMRGAERVREIESWKARGQPASDIQRGDEGSLSVLQGRAFGEPIMLPNNARCFIIAVVNHDTSSLPSLFI